VTGNVFSFRVFALVLLAALAAGLLSTAGADGLSTPAVPTPTVTVPTASVSSPSVHAPTIPAPSALTPSPGLPSISTPLVKPPSVSPPSVGAPPVPSVFGSTPSVPASVSGVATNAVDGSTGASGTGSSNVAASGSTGSHRAQTHAQHVSDRTRAAKIAKLERHLKSFVTTHSLCVATLSARERTVLRLRAGVDGPAYTSQQVARHLHLTLGRETQIEHSGLIQLQQAVAGNGCGASRTAVLQVPSRNQLVAESPVLTAAAASGASSPESGVAARHSVSAASISRRRHPAASPAVQAARIAGTNTPLGVWILLGIGSIAALAVLSTTGRRLALRQQRGASRNLGSSLAAANPAPPLAAELAPSTAEAAGAGSGAMVASAAASPAAASPAAAASPVAGEESRPEDGTPTPAPTPASAHAHAPASPGRPTTESSSAGPAAPSQAGKLGATQRWLRKHRSQIAFALVAGASAAGAVLRIVSRKRGRR
jgi:Sigma-70, region 4